LVSSVSWRPPINPDCDNGKHSACGGDAWNFETDASDECHCYCHRERKG
jgi:hypothetical protein